jgi:hypothetical protein
MLNMLRLWNLLVDLDSDNLTKKCFCGIIKLWDRVSRRFEKTISRFEYGKCT